MIKYILKLISQALSFSKTETRGTFILIIVVFFTFVSTRLIGNYYQRERVQEPDNAEMLTQWVEEVQSSIEIKPLDKPAKIERKYIPKKVVKNSKFKKREEKPPSKSQAILKPAIKDINQATEEDLQRVRGIGKVYSKRIIKYRELLGGFSDLSQVAEVYGLNDELVHKIDSLFDVQSEPTPFAINTDSVKTLARHPYISYDLAWIIVNYRNKNGDIKSFDDLANIKAINDSLLNKLKPYIR